MQNEDQNQRSVPMRLLTETVEGGTHPPVATQGNPVVGATDGLNAAVPKPVGATGKAPPFASPPFYPSANAPFTEADREIRESENVTYGAVSSGSSSKPSAPYPAPTPAMAVPAQQPKASKPKPSPPGFTAPAPDQSRVPKIRAPILQLPVGNKEPPTEPPIMIPPTEPPIMVPPAEPP